MTPGRRFALAMLVLLLVLVFGSAGYMILQGFSLIDAVYMTLVTVSTVGMASRELASQLDTPGKLWTILLIFFGIGTVSVAFTSLLTMATGGEIRRILGRRQLNAKIAAMRAHVVVCGFGRVGRFVCQSLHQAGQAFVLIDISSEATREAERLGYVYQLGDASTEETLQAAGLDRARALVTVLPSDAQNVYVTLTARGINEAVTIVARAEQPTSISKLTRAGANRVICPQILGANRISEVLMRPAVVDFYEMASAGVDLEMDQVVVADNSVLIGSDLRQARLRDQFGVMIIAIRKPDGRTIYNPSPDLALAGGDVLVIIGPAGATANLRRLQKVGLEAKPPVSP